MEWHGGLLYVAGGVRQAEAGHIYLNTFRAFNEATGLWEDLPPMPHACGFAASGVIGNQLFIAGGMTTGDYHNQPLSTLQIYDFTTRTWRIGQRLPRTEIMACGIVVGDGRLYLVSSNAYSMKAYDVQSNTWTDLVRPPLQDCNVMHAFAHNGSIVVVYANGTAFHRGTGSDPDWYPFDLGVTSGPDHGVAESVILG